MTPAQPLPWPSGCPWSGFESPTLRFCENNLCAWIAQPANTWSNLLYVLMGLWIIWKMNPRYPQGSSLRWVGPIEVAVGICSFAFHASYTLMGEMLDLSAMFLFSSLLFTFNTKRMGWIHESKELPAFFTLLGVNIGVLALAPAAGIAIFTGVMIGVGILELVLFLKRTQPMSYRNFWIGNLFLFLSQVVWQLDFRWIWCAPDNHWLQGHALWHLLNSFCFPFALLHYAQFASLSHRTTVPTNS